MTSRMKSSRGVRKVNPKRRAKEWPRKFGSKARVLFVKGLPCVGCGRVGYSANAHTENEGKSRKGHYTKIAPLCEYFNVVGVYTGCHIFYDQHRRPFDTEEAREKIKDAAAETQRLWLLESGESA